jgi:hypothetical protein
MTVWRGLATVLIMPLPVACGGICVGSGCILWLRRLQLGSAPTRFASAGLSVCGVLAALAMARHEAEPGLTHSWLCITGLFGSIPLGAITARVVLGRENVQARVSAQS